MGRCQTIITNELLARIKDPDGDIARRVTVIVERPFCDDTVLVLLSSPILPGDEFYFMQDIIIEDDGTIWFKKDLPPY